MSGLWELWCQFATAGECGRLKHLLKQSVSDNKESVETNSRLLRCIADWQRLHAEAMKELAK